MRLIDADALIEEIKSKFPVCASRGVFRAFVDDAPTIEAVPVVHVVEELEKEVEWTSTHGTDKMFRDGRLSGLRTAKRIVGGADMRKKV